MDEFNGILELNDILQDYIEKISSDDKVLNVMQVGADAFTRDLLKLPRPISSARKLGYTHLVKTFANTRKKKEIEVGWGKYYGRMVEDGTKKMKSQQHLKPLWNKNEEKYYKLMIERIHT